MSENTLSSTVVKEKLGSILKRVSDDYERFIITVKGRPQAVLLSYDEFEDILDELEIGAQNPNFIRDREQAREDYKSGKTVTLDELNQELGLLN